MKNRNIILLLLLSILLQILCGCEGNSNHEQADSVSLEGYPIISGDDYVFPTILVNGQYYRWSGIKGLTAEEIVAAKEREHLEYYGKIKQVFAKYPKEDCELTSLFEVSGDIYTVQGKDTYICLYLSTEWLEDALVSFGKVKDQEAVITDGLRSFGFDEIYPTVKINKGIYEWHHGEAIVGYGEEMLSSLKLSDNIAYYGDINHTDSSIPQRDKDFSSFFDVEGEIYVVPDKEEFLYVRITTDWINDAVIRFDKVALN
jgi:hypothetical protein